MRFIGPELILATTDLTKFVRCDHATLMDHGTKNGTITPLAYRPPSPMTELIGRKGDEHEDAHVEGLRAAGKRVVTIEKAPWSLDALRRARSRIFKDSLTAGQRSPDLAVAAFCRQQVSHSSAQETRRFAESGRTRESAEPRHEDDPLLGLGLPIGCEQRSLASG